VSGEVHGTAGPLPRLARLLLGRNELRRPCDRIEGAIVVALSAAFLTATVMAALLAGHLYQSQRAAVARLRSAVGQVTGDARKDCQHTQIAHPREAGIPTGSHGTTITG
jgi:hypothetical protein